MYFWSYWYLLVVSTYRSVQCIVFLILLSSRRPKIVIKKHFQCNTSHKQHHCSVYQISPIKFSTCIVINCRFLTDRTINIVTNLSHITTRPTNQICSQRRLRSAWVSVQSNQSLCCALYGKLKTQTFFRHTAKTLIRPGGCPC